MYVTSQESENEILSNKTVTVKYFNLLISLVFSCQKRPEKFVLQVLKSAEKSSPLGLSNEDPHFGTKMIYFELFLVPQDIFLVLKRSTVIKGKK